MLQGWCLVVVFDKHSTPTFNTGWNEGEGHKAVVLLTPDDQKDMKKAFIDRLPWNTFGRKNIGYIYAIMHGAHVIWDFDDDNMLKFWLTGAAPPGAPSLDATVPESGNQEIEVREPDGHQWPTYNPYPALGAPTHPSWPRGLPLDDIKVPNHNDMPLKTVKMKASSLGVLQSLAEHEPDVDAIFRLTMPIPFMFKRLSETKHLMMPLGSFTPYNAQATLHFRASFFSMYLPITVTGRVSDIWRSYVSQRLFRDVGLRVGFMARPLVIQDRNLHSNIADFTAEIHLYTRAKQLVEFLNTWKGTGESVAARTEELWIALYEREYFELEDVKLVQLWLQTLIDIGYDFPELFDNQSSPTVSYALPHGSSHTDITDDEDCTFDEHGVTIWTSDLHDGSRLDVPSLLASLGQNIILAGHKKTHTPYPEVFQSNRIDVYMKLSKTIDSTYHEHSTRLKEDMTKANFNFFKDHSQIASTDVFLCQFPSSMCELWMPFNKTIAFVPVHRYNLGRCTKEEWDRLNQHLQMLATMKNPKHIIGAGSFYDQQYLRHYTGIDPLPLHSYCGEYTMPSIHPFNPTKNEILLFSHMRKKGNELVAQVKRFKIVDVYSLYKTYTLKDLVSHRAIVYIPYSVMSYKMSEIYSLGIPVFVPSVKFFRNNHGFGPDRSSLSRFYCKNPKLDDQMKPHPQSPHPYSPNVEWDKDPEAECYWLQMADFYHWPHITQFDDMADLEKKLESADFHQTHQLMMKEMERKKAAVTKAWCRALKNVETGRKVPQDYNTAIQQLYGVTRLQVN